MDNRTILDLSRDVADGVLDIDSACEGLDEPQRRELTFFVNYTIWWRRKYRHKGQRRAMRLLRSLLAPDQLEELRRRRYFTVTGTTGGRYRLFPSAGAVQRIERHGSRDYLVASFCYHDLENEALVPMADRSIAHLLMLRSDEPYFLEVANMTVHAQMWNRRYLRQLRAAREARVA